MHKRYHSWGRYPQFDQSAIRLNWRSRPLSLAAKSDFTYLPFGNGRSYGDSCLNEGGVLLDVRGLDRFISLDFEKGVLQYCYRKTGLNAEETELHPINSYTFSREGKVQGTNWKIDVITDIYEVHFRMLNNVEEIAKKSFDII